MIGEFLLGILGDGAYDTAKRAATNIFGTQTDERISSVYEALDSAGRQFFERFGTTFGSAPRSFLARQSNWDAVVDSLYYGKPGLSLQSFDRRGFDEAPDATDDALRFLLLVVERELRKNWELDKVLTEKASLRRLEQVADVVESLTGTRPDPKELNVNDPTRPSGWSPEQDKLYTAHVGNGAVIRYILKDDSVNVEYVFPDGAAAYYDVDFQGNVRDYKSPYPLEEYKVVIDPAMVLSTEQQQLADNLTRTTIRMKWGRRVETVVDENGRLKHFHSSGGTHVDHNKRLFTIMPPPAGS